MASYTEYRIVNTLDNTFLRDSEGDICIYTYEGVLKAMEYAAEDYKPVKVTYTVDIINDY